MSGVTRSGSGVEAESRERVLRIAIRSDRLTDALVLDTLTCKTITYYREQKLRRNNFRLDADLSIVVAINVAIIETVVSKKENT